MDWSIYDYENEAERYMRIEEEKKESKRLKKSLKYSPVQKDSKFYQPAPSTFTPPYAPKQNAAPGSMDEIMQVSRGIQDVDTYVNSQYEENTKTIFKGLKTPDFKKVKTIKSGKIDQGIQTYVSSMGLRVLREKFKVYKYKTVDQKTGDYLITPETEIEVVAENENNFYYIKDGKMASVAKNETSPTFIEPEELEKLYKSHINEMAKNIRRNSNVLQENTKITAEENPLKPKNAEGFISYVKRQFSGIPENTAKFVGNYIYEVFTGKQSPLGEATGMDLETELTKLEPERARKVAKLIADVSEGYMAGYTLQETENPTMAAKVGELSSLLIPNTPGNLIFSGAEKAVGKGLAKVGLKEGSGIIKRVARKGIQGALGFGAFETARQTTGYATDKKRLTPSNLKESGEKIVSAMKWGGGFGVAVPIVGAVGKGVINKLTGPIKAAAERIAKYEPEFISKYGLNRDISKLSKVEKAALEKETTSLLLKDIGSSIEKKIGTRDPEKLIEYYKLKYKLKGKISIDDTLQGESNFGRVEIKGDKIEVRYNRNKDELEVLGSLREEIEHLKNVQEGFIGTSGEMVKKPRTLLDLMSKKGHIKDGERFEIDYLEKIFKDEKLSTKETSKVINETSKSVKLTEEETALKTSLEKEKKEILTKLKKINTKETKHQLKTRLSEVKGDLNKLYEKETPLPQEVAEPPKTVKSVEPSKTVKPVQQSKVETVEPPKTVKPVGPPKKRSILSSQENIKLQNRRTTIKQMLKQNVGPLKQKQLREELHTINQRLRLNLETRTPEATFRSTEGFDPARSRVINEATNLPDYKPHMKSRKEKAKETVEKVYTLFIDNQYGLAKTGEKAEKASQNYKKYNGTVEYINTTKLVDKLGKQLSDKGLIDVLVAPKGYQNEWEAYLFTKHHLARMQQGKPILSEGKNVISMARAKELLKQYETQFPEFQKASQNLNQWMDDFGREWLVDGDLITEEGYREMRLLYPDYVPAYRVLEGEGTFIPSNRISNKVLKEAKGGTEELVPLSASLPAYVQRIVRAQRRNKVYQSILNQVLDNPEGMAKYAQVVENNKLPKDILKQMKSVSDAKAGMETVLNRLEGQVVSDAKTGNFLVVLEKGQPLTLKINDFGLWKGLNQLNKINMSEETALLKQFNKIITQRFKNVVTVYNPFFAVKNIFRDVPQGYIMGSINDPIRYTKELFKSAASMLKKDELYEQFKALGGVTSNITVIEKHMDDRKAKKILEVLNYFGSLSETVPRLTEFKAVYKKGIESGLAEAEALNDAIFASGDVTINFARGGSFTKKADVIFPYMNAGVQGVDKFFRGMLGNALRGNFAPILKSLGAVTVPTIVLTILNNNWNAKAFNDLPNYVRDNNYVIPIGDTEYLKLPKNREIGFLFSTLFDKMYQYFVNGDTNALNAADTWKAFSQSFYMPIEELSRGGLGGPIINIKLGGNKDYFGKNIEPLSMQLDRRDKHRIHDETTSKASTMLGPVLEQFGLSPKQADYFVKSYAGVLAKFYMAWNNQNEPLAKKVQIALKNAAGFTVDTNITSKSRSEEFNMKDKAQSDLTNYELETGIKELRKNLRDSGVTSYTEINEQIRMKLSPAEYSKWLGLKKKLKGLGE